METAVREATEALQETMRELAESQPRFVGELAASLDIEEIAERTLEAAAAIPGVDAALLDAGAPSGERIRHAIGIPAEEADRTSVELPENDNLRAVSLGFRYRIDDAAAESPLVRSGLALPVRSDGTPVGTLSAFSRTGEGLAETQLEDLERLAYRAGPALENARRYLEARALADLDALTGLHNRRYFHETLAREVGRARRYARQLALIVFDLDDFKAINDQIGHLSGDAVLAEVAERMMSVVRAADVACRVGGDEFGVVLPESQAADGELLASRIAHAISHRPLGKAGTLFISAGVAEMRETDDAVELFERADQALYRAKQLGKARTVAASEN
ncbi:MAG TPA: sensor domain-containing diguanylate cyclase [Gaiellaceae bacterium]|nr:sensor domain-containing diguanylate cyclase [Gaiellaceae bacterium]